MSIQVIDWLWPSIRDMYSPWLIPYYTQNMQNTPANWIRQIIANTPILLPWSESYADSAQMIFHSFIDCTQFLLDTFPACDVILGNIFLWYEAHFGNVSVPRHIFTPTNISLMLLPWNRLKPLPVHIHGFYRLLQQVSAYRNVTLVAHRFCIVVSRFSTSIFPIAIHSLDTYFYESPGHPGYNAICLRGSIQPDCGCYPRCLSCL